MDRAALIGAFRDGDKAARRRLYEQAGLPPDPSVTD